MTREEIQKLSDFDLNIAIHKNAGCIAGPLCAYSKSLNALRLAESTLTPEQEVKYALTLMKTLPVLDERYRAAIDDTSDTWKWGDVQMFIAATIRVARVPARQRAEALLMALTEK
jgi:hypothetical protein